MFSYGSKQWPIDLTGGDVNIINLVPDEEVEVVKVVPGAPRKGLVRGVMPKEELEYLKSLGNESRRLIFEEYNKKC